MRDLDDLIAVNPAPEVVLKDLLYGQVEVAFRKKRLVAEANASSALDAPGWLSSATIVCANADRKAP